MVNKLSSDKPKVILYSYFFVSLLILFIGTLGPYSDYTKTDPEKLNDLIAFIVGASIVRDGKVKELYNRDLQVMYQDTIIAPNDINGLLSFRLLPLTAYLYVPLLYLEPIVAFYTQAGINMVLLFLSMWVIKKSFQLNSDVFWLCTSTVLSFIPFRATVLGGQLSTLMLLILCTSIYLAKCSRYFFAGALLGLLFLKVSLVALVPFFFITEYLQNKRSVKGLGLGFLLSSFTIIGINILIYGPNLLTVYPHYLILSESVRYGTALVRNFNPTSVMSLLTDNKLYLFGGSAAISLIIAGLFLFLFRKTKNFDLLYATVPALGLFLNLHTMTTDLTLLILSVYLMGNYYFTGAKNLLIGLLKCFGVIFIFFISTWVAIYDLQIVGLIVMLLFYYFTLRSSIKKAILPLVEMGGIEPPSRRLFLKHPTSLVGSLFSRRPHLNRPSWRQPADLS